MKFLKEHSNSYGHLIMSLAFMVFLAAVIFFSHDSTTVTFATSLMMLLFGYWFGAQSTRIEHRPPTQQSDEPTKL